VQQPAITAILLIGVAVAAQPGWSQDSSSIIAGVLTNPGARSIGLNRL